jgi:hypothetical protein
MGLSDGLLLAKEAGRKRKRPDSAKSKPFPVISFGLLSLAMLDFKGVLNQ